ncbi:MAG: hypothetical protein ACE5RQ_02930 [Nitrosopumilus sp.]
MNIFNVLFRHTAKSYEVTVNINVSRLKLENTTPRWEAIEN